MGELRKLRFFPYSAVRIDSIDKDAFYIARVSRSEAAVAIVNKCPRKRDVSIDLFAMPKGKASVWYGDAAADIANGRLEVTLDALSSAVVILTDDTTVSVR